MQERNNTLIVDLSQPPLEDAIQDVPASVRDALVFLELANFISPACGNLTGEEICQSYVVSGQAEQNIVVFM